MSPLLFLAIAVVIPLIGMIVLGVKARIQRGQATDDETEPFRQRLAVLAPPQEAAPGGHSGHQPTDRPAGSRDRARTGSDTDAPPPAQPAEPPQSLPAPTNVRLIRREYSLPMLPPMGAEYAHRPDEGRGSGS